MSISILLVARFVEPAIALLCGRTGDLGRYVLSGTTQHRRAAAEEFDFAHEEVTATVVECFLLHGEFS